MQASLEMTQNLTPYKNRCLWLTLLCFLSRICPHPPNMTLLIPACLMLVTRLGYTWGLGISMSLLASSDEVLGLMYGWPVTGNWQWLVMSGLAGILVMGYMPINRLVSFMTSSLIAGFVYWLWTNLGVWWQSDLYACHIKGLMACYTMALPFLATQLISDGLGAMLVWSIMVTQRSNQGRILIPLSIC